MSKRAEPWNAEECVEAGLRHTPIPTGYVERGEDAEQRLLAGQKQYLCPMCRRWAIWLTLDGTEAPGSGP